MRKCQQANFFKIVDGWYEPCSSFEEGAFKMKLTELPDVSKLKPPKVCKEDFFMAMSKIKTTVSKQNLVLQDQFSKDFAREV